MWAVHRSVALCSIRLHFSYICLWGGGKGGGTQGRETKTKSTKKKGRGRDKVEEDSDEDASHMEARGELPNYYISLHNALIVFSLSRDSIR